MARSLRFAVALAMALLPFVPAQRALASGTRVTGQVVDAETQQPIAGAEIELQNAGGGPGYHRARSDGHGEFTIDGVATNRYYLFTVGADGYADWTLESWQFPVAQREVRIVVPLDRSGVLAITATTSDGRTPVAGARVTIHNARAAEWYEGSRRDPEPRWTGRDGRVSFDGLHEGAWTVAVEAQGLHGNEVRSVPVRRGETATLAFAMTKPAGLSGSVRLADSTGVAGVTVAATGAGSASATTDADGSFAFADLAPGRYRLEMTNDGFEPGSARDGVVLREGESRDVGVMHATPRPPALSFVLAREVFAPDEKQQIGVRAFRALGVEFTLWRVPLERLLDRAHDYRRTYVQGTDTTGLVRVDAWHHALPDGAPFAWREEDMPLAHEQPAGVYVLDGRAGRLARRALFFVSDLSLVVKRSPSRVVVWAGSLKTGLPLEGVSLVTTGTGPNETVAQGRDWSGPLATATGERAKTDADGLASLPAPAGGATVRVVAVSDAHGVAIADVPLSGEARAGGGRLFLFTERPIYRPGQTVDWKLFARRANGEGWALPDASDVTLALAGPDGATIEVGGAKLSPGGSADGKVEIPQDVPLGDWTLSATTPLGSGSAALAIQQYRKPEYQVDVSPERDVLVNGDEARFRIAANYFFGAPVVGAHVRYSLFESRLGREELWQDEGGEEGEEGGGYGRLLESGESRTDVDGRLALSFTPQRVAYDRRLSLEVEVEDASQRTVSSRGTVLVGRGLFTIRIVPETELFMAGQPVQLDVETKDLKGNPVQGAVTVELDQDVWNPLERRYTRSSRPLASIVSTTSALRGTSHVTLAPGVAHSGWLVVRAHADDARGNRVTAETGLWVFDEKVWGYPYRYPSLEAISDREAYAPGDTARILVNTDVKDAAVLACVEGRELTEVRVVHLFGNSGLVKVPIRPGYAPNVFVALHVRRGREVHSRTIELKVRADRHDLAITLTPDQAQYRPRDKARYTVETRDAAGLPVPAEVALGVVDESIYALRADVTPDPHDVFYGRRPNWVTTVVSFPTLYYGGADKGDHGDVRRDFRDVALWAPSVRTGPDGRAQVDLQYPDNLTTWRATARGVSDATLVGTAVSKTLVSKDVVARLAVPRQFTAGDEAVLVSVVNNRSAQPLTGVDETLAASGAAKLAGPGSARTSMAAHGESRGEWAVTAATDPPADGSEAKATFLFRAKAKTDADALEQSVPVRPRAVPMRLHGAGGLSGASGAPTVTLPADLVRGGSSVELDLSPSPAALALGGCEYLMGYPYGCVEQTSSAILPACALLRAAREANVALPGWADPSKRLTPFLEHLQALRSPEGGWGWWGDEDASFTYTVLALDAFARAAEIGVQKDACVSQLEQAQWALPRLLADARNEDAQAYGAFHLSSVMALTDQADRLKDLRGTFDALTQGAYDGRDRLGTAGLACAAVACARSGRAAEAKALLEMLGRRGVTSGAGLSFPSDDPDAWYGDATGNTAFALSAFAAVAPGDARVDAIVRALALARSGRGWRTTHVTGEAATAMAELLEARPAELAGAHHASVTWNGETVFDGALGDGPFAAGAHVTVPGAKLRPGANDVTIASDGGTLHWAWSARALVPSPGPASRETRLAVRREYLHATRVADRRGRPRWLVTPVDPRNPIRVGEQILVRLTLEAPKPLSWLLIQDPKPAGFEIDDARPDGAERPYAEWAEARDESAVFFVDTVGSGETVIEYLIRPEIAGSFAALPTEAGGMYDPDLQVRGAETRLDVTTK